MRFIHISDLHIGKRLCETDLSEDIRHALFDEILGRIYREASEEQPPQALIISGDVYDKSLPSAESEELFGRLLSTAVGLGMKVFVSSGNHDSARRVASNEELLSKLGVYISKPFSADTPLRVERLGEFDIAMLPFISLSDVRGAYPDEEISDMTSAVAAVLRHAGLPGERCCVLAAHQTVDMGLTGGADHVDSCVFDGFAYTCLGHIHTPQNMTERVRYCGSPVCFSGSEAKQPQKYCDIVDIEPDGAFSVQHKEIIPLHRFRSIEDTFARLMGEEYPETEDYCYIKVREIDGAEGIAAQLRTKFPNMLSLSFENRTGEAAEDGGEVRGEDFNEDFSSFYKAVTHSDISGSLLRSAEHIFRLAEEAFANGTSAELESAAPQLGEEERLCW